MQMLKHAVLAVPVQHFEQWPQHEDEHESDEVEKDVDEGQAPQGSCSFGDG